MIAKKSLSFFIEEELQESHGVILYPAWAGATSAAEPYVRHMPHVRRVPDLDLDLVLPLHCWSGSHTVSDSHQSSMRAAQIRSLLHIPTSISTYSGIQGTEIYKMGEWTLTEYLSDYLQPSEYPLNRYRHRRGLPNETEVRMLKVTARKVGIMLKVTLTHIKPRAGAFSESCNGDQNCTTHESVHGH